MKLLLDSHILLWWSAGDPRLGKRAEKLLAAQTNEFFVSAASWWELGIKQVLGRLRIDLNLARVELQRRRVQFLPVTIEHAMVAGALPALHGDPFDHMLVAQASVEGLALLTRDRKLKACGAAVMHV